MLAEVTYCSSPDLTLTELVPFNYYLYKITIPGFVCLDYRHY